MDANLDIRQIMALIPHRYPFLLVDKILEIGMDSGRGQKNVTFNEPCFQGHFPDNPIYPGVFQVEGLAQCAGILALKILQATEPNFSMEEGSRTLIFLGIDQCRFRKPVYPGDILIYEIQFSKISPRLVKFKAQSKVGEQITCESEMMAMIRDENE